MVFWELSKIQVPVIKFFTSTASNPGFGRMIKWLLMRLQLLELPARVKFFISNVADVAVALLNHAN
jgi:hypothetical protein